MADPDEQGGSVIAEAESPTGFLAKLGKALREKEGIDVDLAVILAEHLLTAAPAVDAVAKAKEAILGLAANRANPPQPEGGND